MTVNLTIHCTMDWDNISRVTFSVLIQNGPKDPLTLATLQSNYPVNAAYTCECRCECAITVPIEKEYDMRERLISNPALFQLNGETRVKANTSSPIASA